MKQILVLNKIKHQKAVQRKQSGADEVGATTRLIETQLGADQIQTPIK
jgi:hypothetical protein